MAKDMTTRDTGLSTSRHRLIGAITVQVLVFGFICGTIPQCAEYYAEMRPGEDLPPLTKTFLAIRPAWYLVAMVITVVGLLAKDRVVANPSARRWVNLVALWAGLILCSVYTHAMYSLLNPISRLGG